MDRTKEQTLIETREMCFRENAQNTFASIIDGHIDVRTEEQTNNAR